MIQILAKPVAVLAYVCGCAVHTIYISTDKIVKMYFYIIFGGRYYNAINVIMTLEYKTYFKNVLYSPELKNPTPRM